MTKDDEKKSDGPTSWGSPELDKLMAQLTPEERLAVIDSTDPSPKAARRQLQRALRMLASRLQTGPSNSTPSRKNPRSFRIPGGPIGPGSIKRNDESYPEFEQRTGTRHPNDPRGPKEGGSSPSQGSDKPNGGGPKNGGRR